MKRHQYQKDGFAVASGVISDAELDMVADDIHEVFARRAAAATLAPSLSEPGRPANRL